MVRSGSHLIELGKAEGHEGNVGACNAVADLHPAVTWASLICTCLEPISCRTVSPAYGRQKPARTRMSACPARC